MLTISTLTNVLAQEQSGNFLKAGLDDGNKLVNAYFAPSIKGFGQGINDGWYNTAKPLGILGFDLRFNLGIGIVDKVDQSYNFNNLDLNTDHSKGTYIVLAPGSDPNRQSLYGIKETNPPKAFVRSTINGVDTTIASFTMPNGVGSAYTPSLPMLQLSVGVPKNTEVTLRFFPKTLFPTEYKIRLFGIAVKHDLVQYIRKYKDLLVDSKRPFDLSVYLGYTNYGAEYKKPMLEPDQFAFNPDPSFNYTANQRISFSGHAFTGGFIISKETSPLRNIGFEPFGGINYANSRVNLKFLGDFPITVPSTTTNSKIERVTDPVSIVKYISNVRINAGARIKIYMVTVSAEYSIGTINTVTASLGINIQSFKPYKM